MTKKINLITQQARRVKLAADYLDNFIAENNIDWNSPYNSEDIVTDIKNILEGKND